MRRAGRDRLGRPGALEREPGWASSSWHNLVAALPKDEDWDLWIDWYEARLEGRSDPEEVELVYATVPLEKWNAGPAAANAWVKEQLQRLREEKREEEASEPLDFRDFDSFEVWLRTQAREVAVILTARAAQRLLPQFPEYVQTNQLNQRQISEAAAPLFRALALGRVAAKYPVRIPELGPAAYAAAGAINTDNGANVAGGAAYAAAIAVADQSRTGSAARSLAMRASNDNDKSHWAALSADASFLKSAERSPLTLVTLAERPVWPASAGVTGTTNSWLKLFDTLPQDEAWDVWIEWFQAGLAGDPVPEERERVYAAVPQAKWEEGPATANAWIKAELARLQGPVSARLEATEQPDQVHAEGWVGWDFFLSYSTKDEAFARFVDDVLQQAGYSVFTQFRDISPGADYVREMQRGLAGSDRLVALLSPNFVASKFCQAEWRDAYARDPSGERRKLVPLLIAPADLEPLARLIVFKSLVGLSKEAQGEAILEAIAPRAAVPGPPKHKTKGIFDLRPAGDQLKPAWDAPGATAGEDYGGLTPQELWADMLYAFEDFADFAADPAKHNYLSSDIRREARKLCALPCNLPARPPLAAERTLGYLLRLIADAERRGEFTKHDPIHYHRAELRGQYQRLAALWPELESYRRLAQIDGFEEPNEAARRAQKAILEETAKSEAASPELKAEVTDTLIALREAQEFYSTRRRHEGAPRPAL